jgi:hypothetical protein
VRIIGFDSLPKSNFNHAIATVKAYNQINGKLVVQLPSVDWLVLLNVRHVERADKILNEHTDCTMSDLLINKVNVCAICLSSLTSTCRVQTHCAHVFHKACLNRWIRTNTELASCPLCRRHLNANKPHALQVRTIDNVCEQYSLCLQSN